MPEIDGAFADYLRPMTLLALNSGLRRGELLALEWSDVHFQSKLLTVTAATAKSGQTRRIPLNGEALNVLSSWHAQNRAAGQSGRIFTKRDQPLKQIDAAWSGVTKAAGLTDFRFHDCRHHFASKLVQAGVDLNTVRVLLGHSEIAMTLRYAHLEPAGLAAAVAKVGVRSHGS